MIVLSITVMPVLVALFVMPGMPLRPKGGSGGALFVGIAVAALLGAAFMAQSRLALKGAIGGPVELPPPQKFQTDSLISLALSELAPLLGVFMVYPDMGSAYVWGLVGGMLVVNLLLILP